MVNFNLNTYFNYLEQKELDKAIKYRESCIPEYIYKYVSLSDDIRAYLKTKSCTKARNLV